ncbi:MAG: hypothetical protein ACRDF4_00020, partial [Rhabdochlamydiaceae bacterium]
MKRPCPVCGLVYTSSSNFKTHILGHPDGDKIYDRILRERELALAQAEANAPTDVDAWFNSWIYSSKNGSGKTLLGVQDILYWLSHPNPYDNNPIIVITNIEVYRDAILAYAGQN